MVLVAASAPASMAAALCTIRSFAPAVTALSAPRTQRGVSICARLYFGVHTALNKEHAELRPPEARP